MSVHRTESGTWQVRWRDVKGRHRGKTFKTESAARAFESEVRGLTELGLATDSAPLWKRMVHRELGERAAIDVEAFNPNGHFVYLLWGIPEDRPLYVGRSSNVLARLGSHMNNPDRRHRIARVTLIRCYSAEDAAKTEGQLIDLYQCELNLLDGNGRRRRTVHDLDDVVDELGLTQAAIDDAD